MPRLSSIYLSLAVLAFVASLGILGFPYLLGLVPPLWFLGGFWLFVWRNMRDGRGPTIPERLIGGTVALFCAVSLISLWLETMRHSYAAGYGRNYGYVASLILLTTLPSIMPGKRGVPPASAG